MSKNTLLLALLLLALAGCAKNERSIRAPGVVDGDIVAVRALAAGTLERLLVREGQVVRAGERVAEINRDKVRNGLEELDLADREVGNNRERALRKRQLLQANQRYWQEQAARLERLRQARSVSGDQLEKARLQLQEAQTALFELDKGLEALQIQGARIANKRRALELAERDLLLASPVAGVVLQTYASPGETVLPGAALAEILDLASLYVDVFIEEGELARLALGQEAEIAIDGLPGRRFTGRIAFFGRKAEFSPKYIVAEKERQALLYQVKLRLEQDLDAFKVGMPVTVLFRR